MSEQTRPYPFYQIGIPYASEHRLQTLDICLPRPLSESSPQETVWVVFIHGGAWRDPEQMSGELNPALEQLLRSEASKETLDKIAGFASLNYGLSRYEPDTEEGKKDPALSVKHPTHIKDIFKALGYLQKNYFIGGTAGDKQGTQGDKYNWIAVGHSCGATLSFQVCMVDADPVSESSFPTLLPIKSPIAVVGLEGIYSLPLLSETHALEPFYDFFISSAFGSDKRIWEYASPVHGQYKAAFWNGGLEVVVLGHSSEDELVEWEQARIMRRTLEGQGWRILGEEAGDGGVGTSINIVNMKRGRELIILELEGKHDDIWKEGKGVRTSIEIAVENIFKNGRKFL